MQVTQKDPGYPALKSGKRWLGTPQFTYTFTCIGVHVRVCIHPLAHSTSVRRNSNMHGCRKKNSQHLVNDIQMVLYYSIVMHNVGKKYVDIIILTTARVPVNTQDIKESQA